MKELNQYISNKLYTIKDIDTRKVINKVINTNNYPVLKDHFTYEEIDEDGMIIYLNGKNTSNNIYTNIEKNSKYKWIVLINGKKEIALQLLEFNNDNEITLVIAERSKKVKNEKDTFKKILDCVIEKYNPKKIHTFALHDKLKEKYISYGFKANKHDELTLEIK